MSEQAPRQPADHEHAAREAHNAGLVLSAHQAMAEYELARTREAATEQEPGEDDDATYGNEE